MNRIILTMLLALSLGFINISVGFAQSSCNCFLVKEEGAKIRMEKLVLKDNTVEVITDTTFISVAFSMGEGLNGDMVNAATRAGMMIVQCKNGVLKLKKRSASGEEKPLPDMPTLELKNYDIRLNITGGNGVQTAFKISNYETFAEDKGPVLDMFGGRVPIKSGDYLLTTETKKAAAIIKKKGQINFKKIDGWMVVPLTLYDGNTYQFVVDMAATASVVSRPILPKGTIITKLEAIAYDGDKKTQESASMSGATGAIKDSSFAGRAVLSSLQLGNITIDELSVNVLQNLPPFLLERNINGILGTDVLKKYGSVMFKDINADKGLVVLGESDFGKMDYYTMKTAGGLFFLEGSIQSKPLNYLIDMGARHSFVSKSFISNHQITLTRKGSRTIKGISNKEVKVETGIIDVIKIGNITFQKIPVTVGKIDALSSMGLDNSSLLGMDFFSRFKTVVLDFNKGVLGVLK